MTPKSATVLRPPFRAAADLLLDVGTLKTWSLIVTILGDLASNSGDKISGPVLMRICDQMGLKPEAMRVALHRLRRDGWVESDKSGRTGLYGLTEHGLSQTLSVSEQIYRPNPSEVKTWHMVVAPSNDALHSLDLSDGILMNRHMAIFPEPPKDCPNTLFRAEISPGKLPEWLCDQITPPDMRDSFQNLSNTLINVIDIIEKNQSITVIEHTVLRLLAIHNWRRLVLRNGPATEALFGDEWPGMACRKHMTILLSLLQRPKISDLSDAIFT